jgi:hypothetical protein
MLVDIFSTICLNQEKVCNIRPFQKQCSEKYIYSKFALLKREMENW